LYSGFIQKIRKNAPIEIIQLQGNLTEPDEKKIYDKNTWPMAVYTRLIVNKNKQGEFYTLIGWMGGREGSSRRVLEVLTFDQNGNPVFGAPIFNSDQKTLKSRVIFEFTDQIPFHLAYEQQRLPGKKKKKGWMIVFNHLSGNSRQSRNPYKVLTPNYDKFDAFIFDGTRWQFTSDIDVRMNEKDIQKYSPPADIGLEPK
jgi:hypothetical protein